MSTTSHFFLTIIFFHYPITLPTILFFFFFFNDTATTEIYTLSLHDALPILARSSPGSGASGAPSRGPSAWSRNRPRCRPDRKSTRLNSSHSQISYAVFCLKKKKKKKDITKKYNIKYDIHDIVISIE